jgi:hypothetical protein
MGGTIAVMDTAARDVAWSMKDVNGNTMKMPRARTKHGMLGNGDNLYLFGGKWESDDDDGSTSPNMLELDVLNVKTGSWSVKAPLPTGLETVGAAFYNGQIWIGGSYGPGGSRFAFPTRPLIYDPKSDKWTDGEETLTRRGGAGVEVGTNIV